MSTLKRCMGSKGKERDVTYVDKTYQISSTLSSISIALEESTSSNTITGHMWNNRTTYSDANPIIKSTRFFLTMFFSSVVENEYKEYKTPCIDKKQAKQIYLAKLDSKCKSRFRFKSRISKRTVSTLLGKFKAMFYKLDPVNQSTKHYADEVKSFNYDLGIFSNIIPRIIQVAGGQTQHPGDNYSGIVLLDESYSGIEQLVNDEEERSLVAEEKEDNDENKLFTPSDIHRFSTTQTNKQTYNTQLQYEQHTTNIHHHADIHII